MHNAVIGKERPSLFPVAPNPRCQQASVLKKKSDGIYLWRIVWFTSCIPDVKNVEIKIKQEYVLWNAVSVPLLQFARYCSIVQTLSLKYICVATLTLRLHDVVGHLITLFAMFNFLYVLYRNW